MDDGSRRAFFKKKSRSLRVCMFLEMCMNVGATYTRGSWQWAASNCTRVRVAKIMAVDLCGPSISKTIEAWFRISDCERSSVCSACALCLIYISIGGAVERSIYIYIYIYPWGQMTIYEYIGCTRVCFLMEYIRSVSSFLPPPCTSFACCCYVPAGRQGCSDQPDRINQRDVLSEFSTGSPRWWNKIRWLHTHDRLTDEMQCPPWEVASLLRFPSLCN
jgi:hypothetical protein